MFFAYQKVRYVGRNMPLLQHGAQGIISDKVNDPHIALSPGWTLVHFPNKVGKQTIEVREEWLEEVANDAPITLRSSVVSAAGPQTDE